MRLDAIKRLASKVTRHCLLPCAVALVLAASAGQALAGGGGGEGDPGEEVPEISLGAAGAAMTLLAGGLVLAREGLRARAERN